MVYTDIRTNLSPEWLNAVAKLAAHGKMDGGIPKRRRRLNRLEKCSVGVGRRVTNGSDFQEVNCQYYTGRGSVALSLNQPF